MDTAIINKIKKLLKLGESANEHEATSAVAMAQELMDKHRIDVAILEESTTPQPDEPIRVWEDPLDNTGKNVSRWRLWLAMVLAESNGCGVYYGSGEINIYGRATEVGGVRYLFSYCTQEIDRLAGKYRGNGKSWSNNYRLGCVEALQSKLRAQKAATRAEVYADAQARGVAMVRVDQALARIEKQKQEVEKYAKNVLKLRKGTPTKTQYNSDARALGRRDGATINLGNKGNLGSGSRGQLKG